MSFEIPDDWQQKIAKYPSLKKFDEEELINKARKGEDVWVGPYPLLPIDDIF